jgi:hypothetical protein
MLSNTKNLNAGGPPNGDNNTLIPPTDTCDTDTYQLYDNVQKSVDCVLKNKSKCVKAGSLAYSVNIPNTKPFSCMLDLLTGHYSDCDVTIPIEKRQEAFKAFKSITGYEPFNIEKFFNDFLDHQNTVLNYNAFYIFMPTLILALMIVLFFILTNFVNWVDGLYLATIALIILYGFSILYRISTSNYIDERTTSLKNYAITYETNYEDSFAYWIQGFFAMACNLTSKDGKGWTCNNNCDPCSNPNKNCDKSNDKSNDDKPNDKKCKKNKKRKPCKTDDCKSENSSDESCSDSDESTEQIIV